MGVTRVRWKVKDYLEQRGISAYRLWKATELNQGTAYAVATGKSESVRLETLAAISRGLEKLTGEPVEVSDLLEIVRD